MSNELVNKDYVKKKLYISKDIIGHILRDKIKQTKRYIEKSKLSEIVKG